MVAVLCMSMYYDPKSSTGLYQMGYKVEDGKRRPHMLLLNGMLLRVAVNMVEPGHRLEQRSRAETARRSGRPYSPEAFPDLGARNSLREIEPNFDETGLTDYITGFARAVFPLLNLEPESEQYIEENLHRVIGYLVPKLLAGHLRFYKYRYSEISPEDGGAIAFLDVSNPEQVVFLFPVFGLRKRTAGRAYIPWRPCQYEMQEPEPQPVVQCKDDLGTLAPVTHSQVLEVASESSSSSSSSSIQERGPCGESSSSSSIRERGPCGCFCFRILFPKKCHPFNGMG